MKEEFCVSREVRWEEMEGAGELRRGEVIVAMVAGEVGLPLRELTRSW